MNTWTQKKDGWFYNQEGNQRWRKRPEGHPSPIEVESVPIGESMTQQQFKDDCDVNLIMEKFMKTGEITHLAKQQLVDGDFSNLPSYQEAMDTVIKAQDMFGELPAKIRLRFENDPQQLLDFLNDDKNRDEALAMGLLQPKEVKVDPMQPVVEKLDQIAKNTKLRKKEPEE